ncbi:MAG: serine/threonine-protein kinase [Verrucomicrobia bacterium]|nr:serine/threonine-protein kinase [Verrucomicrobiota bacterium]
MNPGPPTPDKDKARDANLAALLQLGLEWETEETTSQASAEGLPPDDLLGLKRYRFAGKIGEGGFGEVWGAEQIAPVRRQVAIKVLKPGMDTRQVIRRFERERQTLAIMDHPGIAGIFDGGSTSAGRPYFVMERVDGLPLTAYCDQQALSIRARLELFLRICQSVHHAHQKGVLHRDLKPSNILVSTVDGQPLAKVIDFGIAKILDGETDGDPLMRTRDGWILGTPAYISPEQMMLGGLDLDTRADIYSLGVLLYELLTGHTPFEALGMTSTPLDEWAHLLRHVQAGSPSSLVATASPEVAAARGVANPRALVRQVRGDLDWITLKALEKDREKRYESAAALAEDLRRFLADEPVSASPPSTVEVVWKFAKRKRALVGAVLFSVLVLLASAVFSTAAFLRESRMRTHAEAAQREAKAQRDLAITSASEARAQEQRATKTLEYLDTLLSRAADFATRGANPEALRLALDDVTVTIPDFTADPILRETILGRSAIIYRAIGREESAIPLVKAQLEITEAKSGLTAPATLEALALYARSLSTRDHHEEAVAQANELVRRWSSLPQDPETARKCFVARRDRADILRKAGRNADAIAAGASLLASASPETKAWSGWKLFIRAHSGLLREAGRTGEAERLLDEAIAAERQSPDQHSLASLLQEKSRLQRDLGDLEGCARSLLESIATRNRTRGPADRNLPALHVEVSRSFDVRNLNETAVEHCRKAMEIARQIDDRPKLLASTRALAENLENACRYAEAAKACREAADLDRELGKPLGDRLIDLAFAARNLARAERGGEATALVGEIRPELSELPQDSELAHNRKVIGTVMAFVEKRSRAAPQDPRPEEHRLLVSQLAEAELLGFESAPKFQALSPRARQILAGRHANPGKVGPDLEPGAADLLAFDRALHDRWIDYDPTGPLFHLAACLRLARRPDLACAVYQEVIDLPAEKVRVPGRQTMAKLHQAQCLLTLDHLGEAAARLDEFNRQIQLTAHTSISPAAVECFIDLQSHLSPLAQNSRGN